MGAEWQGQERDWKSVIMQNKANFFKEKLTQPSLPQRIMKMNHAFRLRENKPNQTQFQTGTAEKTCIPGSCFL